MADKIYQSDALSPFCRRNAEERQPEYEAVERNLRTTSSLQLLPFLAGDPLQSNG
jgi:hypothetical protein